MNLTTVKNNLEKANLFHSDPLILGYPSMVGYEKKFRWAWMATQLNTFMVATDFGDKEVTVDLIQNHLSESFELAKNEYTGWPRGLQSALGVISVLIGSNITEEAKDYCTQLKSGKKWAGFSVPVVYDSSNEAIYQFDKNPIWGRIYYPHFSKLIALLR